MQRSKRDAAIERDVTPRQRLRPNKLTPTLTLPLTLAVAALALVALAPLSARAQRSDNNQSPCPSRCNWCRDGVANCTSRSMTAPPRSYPPGTRIINLKGNHIRVLGMRTFHRLPSLEVLKLNNNKVVALRHLALRPFPNVATVDLSENRISRVSPRALSGKASLTTLLLNRNRIHNLAGLLSGLSNLYHLNLAKNRIGRLDENDFRDLARVSYLDLRNNRISSIHPRTFANMTRLRYLFLESNSITLRLPELVFSSQVLQLVDFSKCNLPSVPKTFPASLSDYRLGHNHIMQVNFTDFTAITQLQLLALNDNELHFFADGALSHLGQLKEVWLRRNNLVYVPRDLPDSLERLHMDSNHVQEIEAGLFSANSQLQSLTVENNQIWRLQPDTFAGMPQLRQLNFQGNQLQVLEAGSFRDVPMLETLLLSNNPLRRIESGAFQNLNQLQSLYLSYVSSPPAPQGGDGTGFEIGENFLVQMPALQRMEMMASPALADAFMAMLDALPASALAPMEAVTNLDLSFNTLEYVSPRLRAVFPNLRSAPLDGNPFRCTQRLRWLRDWMLSTNVELSRYEALACDSPPELYGRPLHTLEDNEWGNDQADRSLEFRNAHLVNQHAAEMMARDMPPGSGYGYGLGLGAQRSSFHVGTEDESTRRSTADDDGDEPDRDSNSMSRRRENADDGVTDTVVDDKRQPERPANLLKERANREERRKRKLRRGSRGGKRRRGGKGKGRKNKRKGKKKGKGGRKGRKGQRKIGGKKRGKRDVEAIVDENGEIIE